MAEANDGLTQCRERIEALEARIRALEEALERIDRAGSGVSPECEKLAAIAREALDANAG